MAKNFIKSLTVENGMVKLYHYSDKKITSGFISVNKPYNVHSQNEFTAWGKSRSFFYVNEDGYRYDKGIKPKFLYVCYIPVTDIYPINDNPYKYEKFESDLNQYDSYFKQSWDDGFTAWGYFLGGNKKAPIIVSFIDLPISESYKFSKGGLKVPMEDEELDYRIGSILIGDEKYFVMQKGGYPLTLLNCYLTDERNPKKAMKSYQKTLEVYMWDDLLIDKEFIRDYIKDLKKSKIWRKRLSESNLKLKSRAKEQELDKQEYLKELINKGIENLTTQELLILVSMGEYEKIFDKIKEDLGALLNYWDTSIITQKLPYKERKDLLFILGKTKVLLQINSILGSFHINRYNVDIKTSSTWGYSYYDMLNKLKKILAEGDITNE